MREGERYKRLRVAYLYHGTDVNFSEPYAVQLHIYHQISGLQRAGHHVDLLSLAGRRALCTGSLSIFHDCPPGKEDFGRLGVTERRSFQFFESAVRRLQRDLELPHLAMFDSYRMYDACLHNLSRHDVFHERYNLLAFGGALASRKLGIPYILEVNADLLREREAQGASERGLRRLLGRLATRFCLDAAERVICVSSQLQRHLIHTWRVDERKIVVLPNGADTVSFGRRYDRLAVRRRIGVADEPLVTFVGGFYLWHDLELLVASFSDLLLRFPTAKLMLVGDGRTKASVERLISEMKIEPAVLMVGPVSHSRVPELLSIATIAVAPTIPFFDGHGGSPLKLFEYMAAGKAIVATGTGQTAEIISDGHNGLLVDAGDRIGFAKAMASLINDPQLRHRLGRQARRDAVDRHSWKHYVRRLEDIYSEILSARNEKRTANPC